MNRLRDMLRLVHSSDDAQAHKLRTLDEEALSWVVLLTSGESTQEDHSVFRKWRDQSPAHGDALARARTLWTQVGAALPRVARDRKLNRRLEVRRAFAVAASLLLCLGLTSQYLSVWQYDQVTQAGERRTVSLPDGSQVVLGGDTALTIDYQQGLRRIDLARGQGLFRIAHNERQPFVVKVGSQSVRDLGTVFEVERSGSDVQVVVAEGVVEAADGDRRAILTANEQVRLDSSGIGAVQPVDAAVVTAWSQGRLIVENRPLVEILEALAPHYRGRIYLLNRAAGEKRLSAVIDLDRVDDWLAGVAKTKRFNISRLGQIVILT